MSHEVYSWLMLAIQMLVGCVFGAAALLKVRHPLAAIDAISGYGIVPRRFVNVVTLAVVTAEGVAAILLVSGIAPSFGSWTALALSTIFLVAVCVNLVKDRRVKCGCFGDGAELISKRSAFRLLLLIIGSLLVSVHHQWGRGQAFFGVSELSVETAVSLFGLCAALLITSWWLLRGDQVISLAATIESTRRARVRPEGAEV